MSIAKRVAETFERMAQNDAEAALLPISTAIDATATKHFKRRGRKSYKDFIHENLGLITKVGFGPTIMNINLRYNHPDLKAGPNGLCTIQDILYHVVRCGLAHAAELPSTLKFVDENRIQVENGLLVLPASLIYGLIVAVIVCPENSNQTISSNYVLNTRGFRIVLNDWWGRKSELEDLLAGKESI
ncbi:MAG: hypothetical protein HS116_21725 [Planctomycetes bacterium]|nr:hypothetical protein [Planctomycetota bacterium]